MNSVIVAGSRDIKSFTVVQEAIKESGFQIDELICGMAAGVDSTAYKIYKNRIPVKEFPANWNKWGKSAGYKRNVEMANAATHLIAIRRNNSKGTTHMINIAKEKGLIVFVKDFNDP